MAGGLRRSPFSGGPMRPSSSSIVAVVLCCALACGSGAGDRPASLQATRSVTAATPIQHVVVLMMENRSFDHFLGWVPGADGQQAGLTFTDSAGVPHPTFPLAPDFQGCLHPDPDHSYA